MKEQLQQQITRRKFLGKMVGGLVLLFGGSVVTSVATAQGNGETRLAGEPTVTATPVFQEPQNKKIALRSTETNFPTSVDHVWGVDLDEKKDMLSASEAEAIALRIQEPIDQLPPYQFPDTGILGELDREDLVYLIEQIRPAIETNGFTDPWPSGSSPPKVIEGVNFIDYMDSTQHFLQLGQSNCGTQLLINANYKNPLAGEGWYRKGIHPEVVNVMTHELAHDILGEKACKVGDALEEQGETTAQIIAAETEAYLINRGHQWALEPLLLHLRELAIGTVAYYAIENMEEGRMQEYLDFVRKMVKDDYYAVMLAEKKVKDLVKTFEDVIAKKMALRNLRMYNLRPLEIMVGATRDDASQEEMAVDNLVIPNNHKEKIVGDMTMDITSSRKPSLDDLQFVLRRIDDIVNDVAKNGYPVQQTSPVAYAAPNP